MFMCWFNDWPWRLPSLPVPPPRVPSRLPCILATASRSFDDASFCEYLPPRPPGVLSAPWPAPRSALSPDRWTLRLLAFTLAAPCVRPEPGPPCLPSWPSIPAPLPCDSPFEDFFRICKLWSKSAEGFPNLKNKLFKYRIVKSLTSNHRELPGSGSSAPSPSPQNCHLGHSCAPT